MHYVSLAVSQWRRRQCACPHERAPQGLSIYMLTFWVWQNGRAWYSHVEDTKVDFGLGGSGCLPSVDCLFWLAGIFLLQKGHSISLPVAQWPTPPTLYSTTPKSKSLLKGCPVAMHPSSASGAFFSGGYGDRTEPFYPRAPRKHSNCAGVWAVGVHPPSGGHPALGQNK